ncbi:MAG: iron-containing alcohol dehydrogenase [Lachnospiraceae bacterium]|nr:iron-containing alcohol dehydrogenase [Lachnospiraceae bacterium]
MAQTKLAYEQYLPTKVLFGAGQLNNLHKQAMPGKKALVIISNGKSTRANGYLDRTLEQLEKAGVKTVVYDGVAANPTVQNVDGGVESAREFGADFLVALGGGSVMDCTKAIALLSPNEGKLWDYVPAGVGSGKGKTPGHAPLPLVAITTTAGTGSEVDYSGVITNEATNEKGFIGDVRLFPVISVVDPELMQSVPPKFTAYQGFDALFHSVESYISNAANIDSDMRAREAIRNIAEFLPRAVQNGKGLEARAHVAFANTLSGEVMTISMTTSEHSMEHALSAYHPALPHGAGLIMISKAYFSFFVRKHVCDDRFIDMARLMGKPMADRPEEFIDALVSLQKACGVENLKMSDYGIKPEEFPTFAKNAREVMGILFNFDRYDLAPEDVVAIYKESYK